MHWLTPNISNNHHTHVQWGLMPNIEYKNKSNSCTMGLIPIMFKVKIRDITSLSVLIAAPKTIP